jgi:hypothetical protein
MILPLLEDEVRRGSDLGADWLTVRVLPWLRRLYGNL